VIIVPDSLEIGVAISDLALMIECATVGEMQNVVLYFFICLSDPNGLTP